MDIGKPVAPLHPRTSEKMEQLREYPDILDRFWRFARGDTNSADFESWLYSNRPLERILGEDIYLDAISVNFRDRKKVADFRGHLFDNLPRPAECDCHGIRDYGSIVIGHSTEEFEYVARKADSPAWIFTVICRICGTRWTVAEEGLIYDLWIVFRGEQADLAEANSFRGLLSLAAKSGVGIGYVDPWQSRELPAGIERLARESSGISLTELTDLLPVHRDVVRHHARQVIADTGLFIDMDR